ncbi:MAG TPA: extracellular solute-binding protein [Roseiarcus sp.]|nr:extracellular solute-binding protein [Roseiarcus sp.]
MKLALATIALAFCASFAVAAERSPFAPPAKPQPHFIHLLAFGDYFDANALAEFESRSGRQIAYDAYGAVSEIAAKLRDGHYDLVVLPGPALREEIAAGALQKIDEARLANAGAVAPRVAAKLEAYDPSGAYALPYMWLVTGLLLDESKIQARLGAGPVSWGLIFSPDLARRFADCGVATPNDRDNMFMAAWRYMGVNPARLNALEIKRAAEILIRLKMGARAFSSPDIDGALANGSACVSVGAEIDARRAMERAKQSGQPISVRFVIPREGAPMSIDSFAIPKDAPHPDDAYALLDFLLRPDIAARNARATGVASGDDGGDEEAFKRLSPEGAISPALEALVDQEWTRIKGGEKEGASGKKANPHILTIEPRGGGKAKRAPRPR